MGSSFCDPTREICPFGAPIDPTLALVNNVYRRATVEGVPTSPPGVAGPFPPVISPQRVPLASPTPPVLRRGPGTSPANINTLEPPGVPTMPSSLRQAPSVISFGIPPFTLPGGRDLWHQSHPGSFSTAPSGAPTSSRPDSPWPFCHKRL